MKQDCHFKTDEEHIAYLKAEISRIENEHEAELAALRAENSQLKNDLLAALKAIKTATDEHRADMEDWIYNSIVATLKKYEAAEIPA